MKKMSFSRFSGLERIRIAPTYAMAPVRMVGGSVGRSPMFGDDTAFVERH
jgi:hypothetical protein